MTTSPYQSIQFWTKVIVISLLLLPHFTLHSQNLSSTVSTKFLALGDSYTIGESVPENERWRSN